MKPYIIISLALIVLSACNVDTSKKLAPENDTIQLEDRYISISRDTYKDQLHGFWLGQCIANWTGLVTEMDKIGNIGDIKTGDFYTREDWTGANLIKLISGLTVRPATSRQRSILY